MCAVEWKSIGSLLTRKRLRAKNLKDVPPVYAITNNKGFVLSSEMHEFTIHSEDTSNYSVIEHNDFAYNPSRLNIGSIAYFKSEDKGLISPMYVVFHANDELVIPEYLYIVIKSETVRNKIDALKEVGARFRFDYNRWNLIQIPIPPLAKQQEIVSHLDTFTTLISNLESELEMRRKQYEHYRNQLLDFEGVEGVEWKTLGDVCIKTENIKWKNTTDDYYYIDLSSVERESNRINEVQSICKDNAPSRAQQIVLKDDVLFGTTRPTLKRICIVPQEYDNQICSTGFCVIRANKNLINHRLLYYLLTTLSFYLYVENNQEGAGYPSISNSKIMKYEVPIPSKQTQQAIVEKLDAFEQLIQSLETEIKLRKQQYEYYREKLLTFEKE